MPQNNTDKQAEDHKCGRLSEIDQRLLILRAKHRHDITMVRAHHYHVYVKKCARIMDGLETVLQSLLLAYHEMPGLSDYNSPRRLSTFLGVHSERAALP